MSSIFAVIALGMAVVPATPVEPNTWLNPKDNLKTALQVAQQGYIKYRIDVLPNGKPLRCEPDQNTELGKKVCSRIVKRAQFRNATDNAGQPTFGVHGGVATFELPGKSRQRPDPQVMTLQVAELPPSAASPAFARVAFAVDRSGAIGDCVALAGGGRMPTVEALVPVACQKLRESYKASVVQDAGGSPVNSVQSAFVKFELTGN